MTSQRPTPPAPFIDVDGYPDHTTLHALREWPRPDVPGVLAYLEAAWHPVYGSVRHELTAGEAEVVHAHPGEHYLRLATGGWSGNEDLITAFRANLNYFLCWRLSARGGLFIFQIDAGRRADDTEPPRAEGRADGAGGDIG